MKKVFILFVLLLGSRLSAQWKPSSAMDIKNPQWKEEILSLLIDNNTIYAGTKSGVYSSSDNGKTWVNPHILQNDVRTFAVTSTGVLAGLENEGIFISTDKSKSWKECGVDLSGESVFALAISGSTIYAGTKKGVYSSADNGKTWTALNTGMENISVISLAVKDSAIYAGTEGKGLFYSKDKGKTWVQETLIRDDAWVQALLVIDSTVLIGTNSGTLSLKGGSVSVVIFHNALSFVQSGTTLVAGTSDGGILLSTDGGTTWNKSNKGLPSDIRVLALAVNGNTVYAGTNQELWINQAILKK